MPLGPTPLALVSLAGSLAIGAAVGIGGFTFIYAQGDSYLTDNPSACANCHLMNEQYEGWRKSSHHAVAVCNDCHTPHNFVGKYFAKARNGFNHSWAFTSGRYPDPVQITPHNKAITEEACRDCHRALVAAMAGPTGEISCLTCHRDVGHLH